MVRKNNKGGQRTPAKPKATSLPQSGDRTDGGAGSKKQPLRDMPGLPYGQQQDLLNQQRVAPLPAQQGIGVQNQQTPPTRPNVFAPSERPSEVPTAGAPLGAGPSPQINTQSIDITLAAMYEVSKSPVILDLLNRRQG
tara:strand:+ start:11458 stop:11871 length:414 start_codon:yes stop_codon:yes gene_type:complete